MIDFTQLCAIAYRNERVASRRVARCKGVGEPEALARILEDAAGPDGLATLIAERAAAQLAASRRVAARTEEKSQALAKKMARHDGPATRWRAWFDGSAHPNPGNCSIGGILTGPAGQRVEISRAAGYGNSSEAEYLALIAVLEAALACGADELTVYGDSQGVIEDAGADLDNGAPSLRHLRLRAHDLLARLGKPALRWIPRHKNGEADALSQRAAGKYDQLNAPAAQLPHQDA